MHSFMVTHLDFIELSDVIHNLSSWKGRFLKISSLVLHSILTLHVCCSSRQSIRTKLNLLPIIVRSTSSSIWNFIIRTLVFQKSLVVSAPSLILIHPGFTNILGLHAPAGTLRLIFDAQHIRLLRSSSNNITCLVCFNDNKAFNGKNKRIYVRWIVICCNFVR